MKSPVLIFLLLLSIMFFACQNSDSNENNPNEYVDSDSIATDSNAITSNEKRVNFDLPEWDKNPKTIKGKHQPFDEASNDPEFEAFRQQVYNAVRSKDLAFLKTVIADSIFFSFGSEMGKSAFLEFWNLNNNPEESEIWNELALCLELGGKFYTVDDQVRFAAPYVYMIEGIEDPYGEGVIIGDNVRLREKPGQNGKIIASLSWDHFVFKPQENTLEEDINGEMYPWVFIETKNGEQGYVYGKYTRSAIGYRIGFVKTDNGNWMIEFFIAGD